MSPFFFILIFLGFLQGVTEFLPVSSSAHLVLCEHFPFFKKELSQLPENMNLFINISLHIATLIAVLFFLKKDLAFLAKNFFKEPKVKKIILNILLASIPAAFVGLFFRKILEDFFSKPFLVFIFLIFNGLVLIFSKKIKIESQKIENLKPLNAFFIGLAQAFAILPGLSRSGMTIVAGLKQGLSSFEAAKFSFYMSIPIVAGAGFIPLMKIKSTAINYDFLLPLFASMIITTIIGFMSLKLLFRIIRETRLNYFGYYTLFLGLAGLLFYILYP